MAKDKKKRKKGKSVEGDFSLKRAHKDVAAQIDQAIERAEPAAVSSQATWQSAYIDYFLLIDFGFEADKPFVPNSVQFYSNTDGFLCSKRVDDASLTSLAPILECDNVAVTWDPSSKEAVHIYGMQPK